MTEQERARKYGHAAFATQQAAHVENAQRAEILKKKEEEENAAKLKQAAAAATQAAQAENAARAVILENKNKLKAQSMAKVAESKKVEKEKAAKLEHAAAAATQAAQIENINREYNAAVAQAAAAKQATAVMQNEIAEGPKTNYTKIAAFAIIGLLAYKILKKRG